MTTGKILFIDYQKVYQQLTTDRDEVRDEFIEFLKRLIDKGFKIIASIEHSGKIQNVRLTIGNDGQITESKID